MPINFCQRTSLGGRMSRGLKSMVHIVQFSLPAELADLYLIGPIFSFRVPNRQFIVLSSLKAVTELLDARATTYSDRPRVWMIELAKRSLNPFSISYHHPYFKAYRTAFQNSLSTRALRNYQSVQTEECRVLLDALHKNPDRFTDHIRR
jgi:cytochrome P450